MNNLNDPTCKQAVQEQFDDLRRMGEVQFGSPTEQGVQVGYDLSVIEENTGDRTKEILAS